MFRPPAGLFRHENVTFLSEGCAHAERFPQTECEHVPIIHFYATSSRLCSLSINHDRKNHDPVTKVHTTVTGLRVFQRRRRRPFSQKDRRRDPHAEIDHFAVKRSLERECTRRKCVAVFASYLGRRVVPSGSKGCRRSADLEPV